MVLIQKKECTATEANVWWPKNGKFSEVYLAPFGGFHSVTRG